MLLESSNVTSLFVLGHRSLQYEVNFKSALTNDRLLTIYLYHHSYKDKRGSTQ